jgi:predicted small metal-binding protein
VHHEAENPDRDELLEDVAEHLRDHHDLDHRDERVADALDTNGIFLIHS